MRIAIITVSDTSFAGTRKDESGPTLKTLVQNSTKLSDVVISDPVIVPDEEVKISLKIVELCESQDVVITTGGTGFAPRDVTPEATIAVVDRRCSGLEVALHVRSLQATPMAALSRAVAGIRGQTIVVNFPGSVKAVKECWEVLEPILRHGVALLTNKDDGSVHRGLAAQKP